MAYLSISRVPNGLLIVASFFVGCGLHGLGVGMDLQLGRLQLLQVSQVWYQYDSIVSSIMPEVLRLQLSNDSSSENKYEMLQLHFPTNRFILHPSPLHSSQLMQQQTTLWHKHCANSVAQEKSTALVMGICKT